MKSYERKGRWRAKTENDSMPLPECIKQHNRKNRDPFEESSTTSSARHGLRGQPEAVEVESRSHSFRHADGGTDWDTERADGSEDAEDATWALGGCDVDERARARSIRWRASRRDEW